MTEKEKIIIREAKATDAEFIATAIIESEKSNTDRLGVANCFEITEEEYRGYVKQMLEEEVEGCELSLTSFLVVEIRGEVVAASAGWKECDNEDGMPSALIKSNLYHYFLPKEKLILGAQKSEMVKGIQIEREAGAYQLESSYTKAEYRGRHLRRMLEEAHFERAREKGAKKVQTHVYGNNESSIRGCQNNGFAIVRRYVSTNPQTKRLYPDDTMVLMERKLKIEN